MMIVSITTGLPLAQAGKVRALAVFSETRSPLMPDVPTAAEQGFDHLDLNAWMGLVAPAATPPGVVQKLHAELDAAAAGAADGALGTRPGIGNRTQFAGCLRSHHRSRLRALGRSDPLDGPPPALK